MKKIMVFLLVSIFTLSMTGCSGGVSKESYYALQNELSQVKQERDELLKYVPSETLDKVEEELGTILPGLVLSEINTGEDKILQLTSIASISELGDVGTGPAESFGEILGTMVAESWFDYDYIYLDIVARGVGKIYSIAIDCSSFSIQTASWEDV